MSFFLVHQAVFSKLGCMFADTCSCVANFQRRIQYGNRTVSESCISTLLECTRSYDTTHLRGSIGGTVLSCAVVCEVLLFMVPAKSCPVRFVGHSGRRVSSSKACGVVGVTGGRRWVFGAGILLHVQRPAGKSSEQWRTDGGGGSGVDIDAFSRSVTGRLKRTVETLT